MSNPFAEIKVGWEGSSLREGVAYHDVPLPGWEGPSHRKGTLERVERIAEVLDVQGKVGLDLGCSVGGISFGLASRGARMVAVDYDASSLRLAQRISGCAPRLDVKFILGDITNKRVRNIVQGNSFDFTVWLSQHMWCVKQHGRREANKILETLSQNVPTLVFETAQGPKDGIAGKWGVDGVDGVYDLLSDWYDSVEDLGPEPSGWYSRHLFIARSAG